MPSFGDSDGIIFWAHSKNDPGARAHARLLSGCQQITQQILTIRLAAKQEPTLMLLL